METLRALPLWVLILGGSAGAILLGFVIAWVVKSGRSFKIGPVEIGQRPAVPLEPSANDVPSTQGPVPAPLATASTIDPENSHSSLSLWHTYALADAQELIHVGALLDDLTAAIGSESHTSALAVSGAGGLGKTAVTYEAVWRVAAQGAFTHIVWASAKNTRFSIDNASAASVDSIYWNDILAMIADQLGCTLSPAQALWEDELRYYLRRELGSARMLVVVDNLEAVHAADQVIGRLRALGVQRPHKIVATTRWGITRDDLDIRDVRVPPLGVRETYDLVRLVARDSDSDLAKARDRDLRPVHEITDGNPFLIKLIARLYLETGRSLPRIIDELTAASDKLGTQVGKWLFDQSLDELTRRSSEREAVALLFSFCGTSRGGALAYDELRAEAAIADRFDMVLETACRLGLVRPSDRNQRYSIHSLLYEYTCPIAWATAADGKA